MIIIKTFIYISIFSTATLIGILLSNKYINRVKELKELKVALNIFKTKIRFTSEPLSEIFLEIFNLLKTDVKYIFKNARDNMTIFPAGTAWENALDECTASINNDDKNALKQLGKLLGKTDIDGQISEIELTETFLNIQIIEAEKEKEKNQKLYKSLGVIGGLGIVIILL
ncbi:MAG: stage III sporulation protein AB [Lachnospiraceae bacterium]|jgi:stage III sporulation protein AB|nr:stage III sporulation protein AB [Lachnospiraceae bacterium]